MDDRDDKAIQHWISLSIADSNINCKFSGHENMQTLDLSVIMMGLYFNASGPGVKLP